MVGLAAEARIAARSGFPVLAGGGTSQGAVEAADRLVAQGVTALVSFGFAGGLDPALRPGELVIPSIVVSDGAEYRPDPALAERFGGLSGHRLTGGTAVAADVAAKRRLHDSTRAHAVDLESGAVARVAQAHGLPFVVVRAISDLAETNLPPAALLGLDRQGRVALAGVLGSLLRHPAQLPALMRLALDAGEARRALIGVIRRMMAHPADVG